MSEDEAKPKLRIVSGSQQSPAEGSDLSIVPLPGEKEFPGLPAMPDALLQLELCLTASAVDLQNITSIIRGDVGLTVQLLRFAARETELFPGRINPISEIVIQLGISKLRALAAQTEPLPERLRSAAGSDECERFWTHARVTALIAEELAGQSSEVNHEANPEVNPEEAYLAGLLCHIGDLPEILGWEIAGSAETDSRRFGYRMAKAWGLPAILTELIGGFGEVSRPPGSHALLDIAEAADNRAIRLRSLAARDEMPPE